MTEKPFTFRTEPIRGTRSWEATEDGILTGLFYKQAWTVDDNRAMCRHNWEIITGDTGYSYKRSVYLSDDDAKPIEDGHMAGCNCGFHAFFEGSLDYKSPRRVNGVVELFGRGILAERGGRFTRARILALQIPPTELPRQTLSETSKTHKLRHTIGDPMLPVGCCTRPIPPWALTPEQAAGIRRNYPVRFFATFEAMVAAFPLNPEKEQS